MKNNKVMILLLLILGLALLTIGLVRRNFSIAGVGSIILGVLIINRYLQKKSFTKW